MNKERITLNDELSIDIDKISDDEYTLIFIFYEMGSYTGVSTQVDVGFWTFNVTTPRMVITSNGNVGIGTTGPTHLFHLNGGAYCDGTGDWIAGSDIAYKKNIVDLKKYGLNEVLNLKPVSFIHKQDKNNKIQLGFIAQDVKKFIPEVVDGEEGSYGLEYNRLIPVLVNAIKELNQKIKILEKGGVKK